MMVKIAVLLAFMSMVAAKSVDDKPLDLDMRDMGVEFEYCPLSCTIQKLEKGYWTIDLDEAFEMCLQGEKEKLKDCSFIKEANANYPIMLWRSEEFLEPTTLSHFF